MATWTFKNGEKELVAPEHLAAQLEGGWSLEDPDNDLDAQIAKVEAQGKALTDKYEGLLKQRDERDEKAAEEKKQLAEQAKQEAEQEAAEEKAAAKAGVAAKPAKKKSA